MSRSDRQLLGSPALHCVQWPDAGPPLLLLHGVLRNGQDWESLLPELTQDWRVFVLDHCGHGASARTNGTYHVADYARHVTDFVRANVTEPITVFGHSLGAMVALSLAAECGEKISAIVMEDPPFHTMGRDIKNTAYYAQFLGMANVLRRGGDIAAMADGLAAIRINPAQCLGDVRDRASLEFSAQCLSRVDAEVFTSLVAGRWLDGFEYERLWSRVNCPVLLLQGDRQAGGAFTQTDLSLAFNALRQYDHIHFAGIGHQIHRERPAEVIAALREFVR